MLCHYCGHWNDSTEHRCERCGRRVEGKPGGSWVRAGLESRESQVVPLPLFDQEPQIAAPEPEWKQELSQKLEDYRVRRASREAEVKVMAASAPAPVAQNPNVISFNRGTAVKSRPPARNELHKALHARQADPAWRKVERRPAPPVKLPPLRKADPAAPAAAAARVAAPPLPAVAPLPAAPAAALPSPSTIQKLVAPLKMRAMAGLLDFVLVLVALGVFIGVFRLMGGPVMTDIDGVRALAFSFFTITVFYWLFYIRYIGETAGMTWVGLRLVNFDGQPPTEGQRRARALGTILSTASVGLGFAWSVADDEQLTWHDRMSKTFVVRDERAGTSDDLPPSDSQRSERPERRLPPLRPATTHRV
jgi:uncharacterized RDD family membrane protein YckC